MRFIIFFIMIVSFLKSSAQNTYNYDNKIVSLTFPLNRQSISYIHPGGIVNENSTYKYYLDCNSKEGNSHQAISAVIAYYNGLGYHLKSISTTEIAGHTYSLFLVFEHSSSPRENELYNMIQQINKRIDTTAKHYVDSAMSIMRTTLLNYLKSIPVDVITKEYKDNLTEAILADNKRLLNEAVEELKNEIRRSEGKN